MASKLDLMPKEFGSTRRWRRRRCGAGFISWCEGRVAGTSEPRASASWPLVGGARDYKLALPLPYGSVEKTCRTANHKTRPRKLRARRRYTRSQRAGDTLSDPPKAPLRARRFFTDPYGRGSVHRQHSGLGVTAIACLDGSHARTGSGGHPIFPYVAPAGMKIDDPDSVAVPGSSSSASR